MADVIRHTQQSMRGKQQPPYQLEVYHKDGSVRTLRVMEVPVSDADGQVMAVEGIAQDITGIQS